MTPRIILGLTLLAFTAGAATASAQVEPTFSEGELAKQRPVTPAPEPTPAPTPSESAAAPASAAAPPAPKTPTIVGLRLDGGYTLRKLLDLPITGTDLGLALGAQPSDNVAVWGAARLMLGETENGLDVYTWRLGPDFDMVFDRFRIGLGANIFGIGVHRAARSDTITSWGPALHAGVRADPFRTRGFAIFVRLDGDGGLPVDTQTIYYGAALGLGVDIDIHGERPSP